MVAKLQTAGLMTGRSDRVVPRAVVLADGSQRMLSDSQAAQVELVLAEDEMLSPHEAAVLLWCVSADGEPVDQRGRASRCSGGISPSDPTGRCAGVQGRADRGEPVCSRSCSRFGNGSVVGAAHGCRTGGGSIAHR